MSNYNVEKQLNDLLGTVERMLECLNEFKAEDSEVFAKMVAAKAKHMKEELSRRATGEEAGEYMSNFVNMMCNRKENEEFVQKIVYGTHRTLNQGLIGLFFAVIKEEAEAYRKGQYDLRNEASCQACAKIAPLLDDVYLPFI